MKDKFKLRPYEGQFQTRSVLRTISNQGPITHYFKLPSCMGIFQIRVSEGLLRCYIKLGQGRFQIRVFLGTMSNPGFCRDYFK